MPRNGSGTYSAPSNSWNPAVNGTNATAADWQTTQNDYAAALTQSISSDGQTPMTGNLPMGNNKITGLANGTATTDAVNHSQLGNFSAFQSLVTSQTLTAAQSGQLLFIGAASLILTLPLGSSLAVGTTFNFNSAVGFTLARSGSDVISSPAGGSVTTQKMFSNCAIVWAGTAWIFQQGGDQSSNATAGRVLLPGGLMLNWGSNIVLLNGSGVATINYTAAYTTIFTVVLCNGDNGATATIPIVNSMGTSSFNVVFPTAGAITVRCNWIALGLSA